MTCLKWKIIASISLIARDLDGRITLGSETLIGAPLRAGSRSRAWSRIRVDWYISSRRTR
jgi:hypothetical protein